MKPDIDREIIDTETETEGTPQAMVRQDPRSVLAEFEATAALIPKLVSASIPVTRPQDWIAVGDKVYLQGIGAERIAAMWGLILGEPRIVREDYPDGEFAYAVTGSVVCRKTGVGYQGVIGGRSSRDPFFDSFDEPKPQGFRDLPKDQQAAWRETHRIMPDPMEVQKAAVTNWQTRAASMITGMRGLTLADLTANGITGVTKIEYGAGKKGGDTTPADLKAEQVKLGNEILKRVGGDKTAAADLCREITSNPDKGFKGFDTLTKLTQDWQIKNAWKRLREHATFGDDAAGREAGGEG